MSFGWTAARDGNQVRFLFAVQLALPARPWPVIDGGLKSFLDEPLPHSGNGGGVDQKHTGYLMVPKSFIRFEQRQRPLDGADGRLAPLGNLMETGAFGFSQLDFILDGSHVWALPHRKIIPKYGCLLIFLQIYLEPVLVDPGNVRGSWSNGIRLARDTVLRPRRLPTQGQFSPAGGPLANKPVVAIFSIRTLFPGLFAMPASYVYTPFYGVAKKPPVSLLSTRGVPIDPAVFGYIRVSQAEGESGLATQRRILNDHGLRDDRIFTDVASGRNMRRPSWAELRGVLRPGDTVVVPAARPPGAEPLGRGQNDPGASRPGHQHPFTGRRAGHWGRQSHVPSHAPHAALPGGVGEGHHPGPDQGPVWTVPRPKAGPAAGHRQATGRPPALSSEKVEAVRSFLENGGSVSAAARTFGVSRPTVRAARDGTPGANTT